MISEALKTAIANEPDRVKKWTIALRSGEFEDGYYCLGVACEIYRLEGMGGFWDDSTFFAAGYSSMTTMPRPVREWFGVECDELLWNGLSLADLNDRGTTFKQIADIIDSRPKELFG